MKNLKILKVASVLFISLGIFSSCGQDKNAKTEKTVIKIDGSSTVFPITEAVSEEFQKSKGGNIKVTVGISGTGGGFKKFCRGETDVQDASRPILAQEVQICKQNGINFVELPIAFDALTVLVHPGSPINSITVAELKSIWEPDAQGKIMKWNQVNPAWPDAPLKLYGAGSDSGTFDYFTEAIVGKAKSSRGDYTASEDDNVLVRGISSDKNALGYFGYAYYEENRQTLKAVAVDNGKGAVLPSEKTVEDGTYSPLSRPIFIYVSQKSIEKPEVKEFVEFYIKNASTLSKQVKYIPLSEEIYKQVLDRLQKVKTGTAFDGHSDTKSHISEIMKKELK